MIIIEHWPEERWHNGELALKASTFVRYNRKRVDPWFARYVQGKETPRYSMPTIRLEVDYLYRWPTNEAIACVMYDDTQACVAFWP